MSLDPCYLAYGRYVVTWNSLQPVLDAAIVREMGVDDVRGAILVGALNAKTRLTALRGLLANAGGEKAALTPLLSELVQEGKKQPMIQGRPTPGAGGASLLFRRAEVAGRPAPAVVEYDAAQMSTLADELSTKVEALVAALAVTPAELAALKAASAEVGARRRKDAEPAQE